MAAAAVISQPGQSAARVIAITPRWNPCLASPHSLTARATAGTRDAAPGGRKSTACTRFSRRTSQMLRAGGRARRGGPAHERPRAPSVDRRLQRTCLPSSTHLSCPLESMAIKKFPAWCVNWSSDTMLCLAAVPENTPPKICRARRQRACTSRSRGVFVGAGGEGVARAIGSHTILPTPHLAQAQARLLQLDGGAGGLRDVKQEDVPLIGCDGQLPLDGQEVCRRAHAMKARIHIARVDSRAQACRRPGLVSACAGSWPVGQALHGDQVQCSVARKHADARLFVAPEGSDGRQHSGLKSQACRALPPLGIDGLNLDLLVARSSKLPDDHLSSASIPSLDIPNQRFGCKCIALLSAIDAQCLIAGTSATERHLDELCAHGARARPDRATRRTGMSAQ